MENGCVSLANGAESRTESSNFRAHGELFERVQRADFGHQQTGQIAFYFTCSLINNYSYFKRAFWVTLQINSQNLFI